MRSRVGSAPRTATSGLDELASRRSSRATPQAGEGPSPATRRSRPEETRSGRKLEVLPLCPAFPPAADSEEFVVLNCPRPERGLIHVAGLREREKSVPRIQRPQWRREVSFRCSEPRARSPRRAGSQVGASERAT